MSERFEEQKALLLLIDYDSNVGVSSFSHLFLLAVPWDIIHHSQDGFVVHRSDLAKLSCAYVCDDLGWS